MNNPILIGLASWILPGSGHLMQRRSSRGLIVAVIVWGMFMIAVFSGGAYYPGFEFKDGALLYLLNWFARFGNALGAIISLVISANPAPHIAAEATFEYGGRFLEVAGLLNYLAVIDSLDIFAGRKE